MISLLPPSLCPSESQAEKQTMMSREKGKAVIAAGAVYPAPAQAEARLLHHPHRVHVASDRLAGRHTTDCDHRAGAAQIFSRQEAPRQPRLCH